MSAKKKPAPKKRAKPTKGKLHEVLDVLALPPKRTAGRSSSYKPEYCEVARRLCQVMGATDAELGQFLEVSRQTIFNWRADHPEFAEASEVGKDAANARIKRSLFLRANGYTYEVEKVVYDKHRGRFVRTVTHDHIPADVRACEYWLNNRDSAHWKLRSEVTGPNGGPIETKSTLAVGGMTDEQLRALASISLQAPKAAK